MKKFLLGFLAGIVLISAVVLYLGRAFSPRVSKLIQEAVSQNMNGTLSVSELSTNLLSSVSAKQVVLKDKKGKEIFRADRVRIRFRLLPLVRERSIEKSLRSIFVKNPKITISRNAAGKWNFSSLALEQKIPSKPSPFRLRLKSSGGEIHFEDAYQNPEKPYHVTLRNIQLRLNSQAYPLAAFQVKGDINRKNDVQVNGKIRADSSRFSLVGKAVSLPLPLLSEIVPENAVVFQKGTFHAVFSLRADLSTSKISLRGDGTVTNAGAVFPDVVLKNTRLPVSLSETRGGILFTENSVSFSGLRGKAFGGDFLVEGQVVDFSKPKLLLKATLLSMPVQNLPQLPSKLSGKLSTEVDVRGTMDDPQVVGKMEIPDGKSAYGPFSQLSAYYQLRKSKLSVWAQGAAFDGFVSARGTWDTLSSKSVFMVEGMNLSAEALSRTGVLPLKNFQGTVSGKVVLRKASPLQMHAVLLGKQTQIGGFSFDEVLADVSIPAPNVLHLRRVIGKKGNGLLFVRGDIVKENLHLNVEAENFSLRDVVPEKAEGNNTFSFTDGMAKFQGTVSGKASSPEFSGHLSISKAQLDVAGAPVSINQISGNVMLQNNEVSFPQIEILSGESRMTLEGKAGLSSPYPVSLYGKLGKGRVQDFVSGFSGNAKMELKIQGSLEEPEGEGSVEITEGVFREQKVDAVHANFNILDKTITLQSQANAGSSSLNLEGNIFLKERTSPQLSLQGQAPDFELKDFSFIPERTDVKGKVSLSYTASGTIDAPRFHLSLRSLPDLSPTVKGRTLTIKNFDFTWFKKRGVLSSDFFLEDGIFHLTSNLYHKPSDTLNAAVFLDTKSVSAPDLLDLFELKPPLELDGHLAGRLSFSGDYRFKNGEESVWNRLENKKGDMSFFLTQGRIGKFPFNTCKGTLMVRKNTFELASLELQTKDSEITAQGHYGNKESIGGNLEATGVDASFFTQLFTSKAPRGFMNWISSVQGKVDLVLELEGTTRDPSIMASLEVQSPSLREFSGDRLRGILSYREKVLNVQDAVLTKGAQVIRVSGTIPYDFEKEAPPGSQPIQLSAVADNAGLDWFAVLPQVESASGKAAFSLNVTGNMDQPDIAGNFHVSGGKIKIKEMKDPFKEVDLDIDIQNDNITFKQAQAKFGGGDLSLSGGVRLEKFSPSVFNLTLSGKENVLVRVPPYGEGKVNGTLYLSGSPSNAKIDGLLKIHQGNFSMPTTDQTTFSQPKSYFLKNLSADVGIQFVSSPSSWVENKDLRLQIEGNLRVLVRPKREMDATQPEMDVSVSGELNSKKGTLRYFRKTFNVQEAVVFFRKRLDETTGRFELRPFYFAKAEPAEPVRVLDACGKPQPLKLTIVFSPLEGEEAKQAKSDIKVDFVYDRKSLFPEKECERYRYAWGDADTQVVVALGGGDVLGSIVEGNLQPVLQEEAVRMLAGALYEQLSGLVVEKIETTFHLNEFMINYDAERNVLVRVGKHLDRDFRVSYQQTFSRDILKRDRILGMEYDLRVPPELRLPFTKTNLDVPLVKNKTSVPLSLRYFLPPSQTQVELGISKKL